MLMKAFKINIKNTSHVIYINKDITFVSLYKPGYKFYKNLLYEWSYMYLDWTKKGKALRCKESYALLKILIYK